MSDKNFGGTSTKISGTRVDLGEDLVEETAPLLVPKVKREINPILDSLNITEVTPENISDIIESAKILMNESLLDDAKKLLHQVLIVAPDHIVARKYLNDIHDEELKQIFGDRSPSRYQKEENSSYLKEDPEQLIRKLDLDLGLGLFSGSFATAPLSELSLFKDDVELEAYGDRIEHDLFSAPVKDWIDLGIAFLEMDLYPISIRLFSGACRRLTLDSEQNIESALSATSLLALSLIMAGRPYEAASELQPLLMDLDVPNERKAELYYLMGRIYEIMKNAEFAKKFFTQVREIDPAYRDVSSRMKGLC